MRLKLNLASRERLIVIIGLVLLAAISVYLGFVDLTRQPEQRATAFSSLAYASGTVSIDKKYVDTNGTESSTYMAGRGATIKVRLKYNTTATATATATSIADSLPSGFSFVSGSLKNCYADASCVTLNNALVSGQNLAVGTLAGYFGNAANATVTTLETGKVQTVGLRLCEYGDAGGGWDYRITSSSTDCDSAGARGGLTGSFLGANTPGYYIAGKASVGAPNSGFMLCEYQENPLGQGAYAYRLAYGDSYTGTIFGAPGSTTTCEDAGTRNVLTGAYLGANAPDQPIAGQSSLTMTLCEYATTSQVGRQYRLASNSQQCDSSQVRNIASGTLLGSSVVTIPLNDTTRGYGYIEYQMTAPNADGIFGTDTTFSGSFSNTPLVNDGSSSLTISNLKCDYVSPSGGIRNITLGDAELRTDQDFTCNYRAKICVTVFYDANQNGVMDGAETGAGSIPIQLKKKGDPAVLASLTSDTNPVCFTPLSNGTTYNVVLPSPPSSFSSTGGFSKEVPIVYSSGTVNVAFGYTIGSLSLSAEPAISLESLNVSPTTQTSCGTIHDVQTIDTRPSAPGFTVTGTVDDFVHNTDFLLQIPVANKFRALPGTISLVSGSEQSAPTPGTNRRVTSTTDPFTVFSAGQNYSFGTFKTDLQICQDVAPYTKPGQYQTTLRLTVI